MFITVITDIVWNGLARHELFVLFLILLIAIIKLPNLQIFYL